jgi:two-component system sensor histidine kinase UhpB
MLDRLEAARREQAMLILQAQEEERRRLALELHDESSQNLTALLIHIEVLGQNLRALPEAAITDETRKQLEGELQYLNGLSQHTLENIRALAQQLRPSVLDDLGLRAALRWLVEVARQRLHLEVELEIEGVEDILAGCKQAALYETALFRIAQESLTNVARHAHAQHACLSLARDQGHILLRVRDDGCGLASLQHSSGLGIFGMRERAGLLGGTIDITSRSGQGTTVEARLPLPVENAGNAEGGVDA